MTQVFIVQTFRMKGKKFIADQAQTVKSAQAAITLAERYIETRAGGFAYSQNIDIETDSYDEPVIIYRFGTIPPEIDQ